MIDQTIVTLTGSTVLDARRDGFWLVLKLIDKDGKPHELHFSGRTTKGQAYCGKCGEERLVDIVRDKGRHPQGYCNQCGNRWEYVP